MEVLLIISMAFNVVITFALYYILAHDSHSDKDRVIMQQQIRINQLEFELSGVHLDTYIDEIIEE